MGLKMGHAAVSCVHTFFSAGACIHWQSRGDDWILKACTSLLTMLPNAASASTGYAATGGRALPGVRASRCVPRVPGVTCWCSCCWLRRLRALLSGVTCAAGRSCELGRAVTGVRASFGPPGMASSWAV